MRSPWIDLLRLHGYIIDPRPLRKPSASPSTKPMPAQAHITLAQRTVTSLRLCLGIGDGLLRSQ